MIQKKKRYSDEFKNRKNKLPSEKTFETVLEKTVLWWTAELNNDYKLELIGK